MDFFNRLSIVVVVIIKCAAIAMIFMAVGVFFLSTSGAVPNPRGLPIFEYQMVVLCGICVVLEQLASWYLLYVPEYIEPPKPIGWRPPYEEKRGPHDSPLQ